MVTNNNSNSKRVHVLSLQLTDYCCSLFTSNNFLNTPHCFFCRNLNRTTISFFVKNFWKPTFVLYNFCLINSKITSYSLMTLPRMNIYGNSLLLFSDFWLRFVTFFWFFLAHILNISWWKLGGISFKSLVVEVSSQFNTYYLYISKPNIKFIL